MLEVQEIRVASKTCIHSRKYADTFSATMDVEGQVYECAGLIVGTRIPWMTRMHYVNELNEEVSVFPIAYLCSGYDQASRYSRLVHNSP